MAAGLTWLAQTPRPSYLPPIDDTNGFAAAAPLASAERDPDDLSARLDVARYRIATDDLDGAERDTRAVLERSPRHPRALAYQAMIDLARGRGEAAVATLRGVIAAEPGLVEAHRILVLAYATLGRRADAEQAVARAARLFPAERGKLESALDRLFRPAARNPMTH